MKAIVNGFKKEYTEQEIEYLKDMYGSYEDNSGVLEFKRLDFLTVDEIAELIKLNRMSVYQRYHRDPERYPLIKKGTTMGIDSDKFLKYWIC